MNWFSELFINEVKPALNRHSGGGASVVEPLEVATNGTYTPPDGVDGYSPVTVEVIQGDAEYIAECTALADEINGEVI